MIRLLKKNLKAGIIEEGKYSSSEKGTPQGGLISPVLANIYLHYVLDLWFEKVEKHKFGCYMGMVRYCDILSYLFNTKNPLSNCYRT